MNPSDTASDGKNDTVTPLAAPSGVPTSDQGYEDVTFRTEIITFEFRYTQPNTSTGEQQTVTRWLVSSFKGHYICNCPFEPARSISEAASQACCP